MIFSLEIPDTILADYKYIHVNVSGVFNSHGVLLNLQVDVGPHKETQIKCYGPGLWKSIVGIVNTFVVEAPGKSGLVVSMGGPLEVCYIIDQNDITYIILALHFHMLSMKGA